MTRWLKLILAANLGVLTVLAFVFPHLMVGPGRLIPGHAKLEADCFACHAPFGGSTAAKCMVCHKPQDIGKLTTAGLSVTRPLTKAPFHQQLLQDDCTACHSDHAGVKRYRSQGRFDHALLRPAARTACHTCHKAPGDTLHRQITGNCSHCHTQQRWLPATFDHDKYFVFDRDHKAKCATCHERNDYSRYTCYGCHEHTPEKVRRKHIEEGIRDYQNCVECHRSADEHEAKGRGPGKGGGRRDDD